MRSLTHIRGLPGKRGFNEGEEGRVSPCVVFLELVPRQIEKGSIDTAVCFVACAAAAAGQGVACLGVTVGKGRKKGKEGGSAFEDNTEAELKGGGQS